MTFQQKASYRSICIQDFVNFRFLPRIALRAGLACMMFSLPARAAAEDRWFDWAPKPDSLTAESAIDLRFLNERVAGENGWIAVKEHRFVHSGNGEPMRFWAVNGPPHDLSGAELRRCARLLAKYGV